MKEYKLLDTESRARRIKQIMDALLRKKGIFDYVIISGDEEASRRIPGGIYPYSGDVLNSDGRVFSFWLDWDEKRQDYTLGRDEVLPDGTTYSYWHEVDPKEFTYKENYIRAKQKLGLS